MADTNQLIQFLEEQPKPVLESMRDAGYDKLIAFKQRLRRIGVEVTLEQLSKVLNDEYGLNTSTGGTIVYKGAPQSGASLIFTWKNHQSH